MLLEGGCFCNGPSVVNPSLALSDRRALGGRPEASFLTVATFWPVKSAAGCPAAVEEGQIDEWLPDTPLAPVIGKTHRLSLLVRELRHSHALVVAHRTHMMNLCDIDGRPQVGHLSEPLLERLRAVHGNPRSDHHDGRGETAEDAGVAAAKTWGDR